MHSTNQLNLTLPEEEYDGGWTNQAPLGPVTPPNASCFAAYLLQNSETHYYFEALIYFCITTPVKVSDAEHVVDAEHAVDAALSSLLMVCKGCISGKLVRQVSSGAVHDPVSSCGNSYYPAASSPFFITLTNLLQRIALRGSLVRACISQ